jgi:hypothetical protein
MQERQSLLQLRRYYICPNEAAAQHALRTAHGTFLLISWGRQRRRWRIAAAQAPACNAARAAEASPSPPPRQRVLEYAPDGSVAAAWEGEAWRVLTQRAATARLLRRGPSLRASAAALLAPAGYPDSVTPDYLPFQAWDSVQGLCSYVRGCFTTAALLRGVGVGSEVASPLGATAAFLARDMVGHASGMLFALSQGSGLDASAKQFRFFADCANNVGYALELAAPALPRRCFLPAVCAASVAHALTGVAGGATRAALTAHFARAHNAADVAAKEGSQETVVTLLGMCVGYVAVRATAASVAAQWTVFLILTALHVYANARAVRCVLRLGAHVPSAC